MRTLEILSHFNCPDCDNWFSIGDCPIEKDMLYCPWCGEKNHYPIRTEMEEE